jgi:anti-anti-sigma factor
MLTLAERDGVIVIAMAAPTDLTAAEAAAFDRAVEPLPPGAQAVLDLHTVGFMDSAGIGCVVRLHRRLEAAGGELRLAAPAGAVTTILELVRLHRMLEIHDTVEAGVASYGDDLAQP